MDNDDKQIGRILSRREVLALLGAAGAGALAARVSAQSGAAASSLVSSPGGSRGPTMALPACVVRPQQTEGPYFIDEKLNRADIRSDPINGSTKDGVPLDLELRVARVGAGTCVPLAGAMVDLWQCDALGVYSDVRDTNGLFNTVGQKFLRGYQLTDDKGSAKFTTIYPGWYQGRTVHVHFKIRTAGSGGRSYEFVSQLYFDDKLTDELMARAPYATKGQGRWKNDRDGIFQRGGSQLMLALDKRGNGYGGTFDIGLQMA